LTNKFKANNKINFDGEDPITLFTRWLEEAEEMELDNPNACAMATADRNGKPSVRMVLLKKFDKDGFVFFTNSESQKGQELAENPHSALCFHWKSLGREIRINGAVKKVSNTEANAYFDSRPRESQIGAWASKQSRLLKSKDELEKRITKYTAKFRMKKVPRPIFWEGYRIKHEKIEFWIEKNFRLHQRFIYKRIDGGWKTDRLYP
jgi:pyridoxamine 5'-phosphate oxidase